MMKLTVCLNCKTKFKHDHNQLRKFCSHSCSTSMKNKLSAKPKKIRFTKKVHRDWRTIWQMHDMELVTLQSIKNLMNEKLTNNKEYNRYDLFKPKNI